MMEACPICGYPETHENMPTEELEEDEDHGYCAVCGRNANGKYIYNVYEERGLEEASKILILPEPPVDPERAEFVRLCLGGPDVDLGPCPVCGDEDCRKDHLEGEA